MDRRKLAKLESDKHLFYGGPTGLGGSRPSMHDESDRESFIAMGGSPENFDIILNEYLRNKDNVAGVVSNSYKFMTSKELYELKTDKSYIIDKLLYPNSISMIYSPPAQYKSVLSLLLGISVSKGLKFLNLPTKKQNVLYCDRENNNTILQSRFKGLLAGKKIRPPKNLYFLKQGDLLSKQFLNELIQFIIKNNITLIIFDTLHRFADYDENSADDLNNLYNNVFDKIRNEHKCSILFLHHSAKNGGYRGSSDIQGMVDTAYRITRKPKTNKFMFECTKARAGELDNLYGEIDFSDETIIVKTFSEPAEKLSLLKELVSKQKELTQKIKEFAPETQKFKRKDIAFALEQAGIDFSLASLKRALNYLRDTEQFFEFDEKKNEYWRAIK